MACHPCDIHFLIPAIQFVIVEMTTLYDFKQHIFFFIPNHKPLLTNHCLLTTAAPPLLQ